MKSENVNNLADDIITRLALLSERNTESIRALRGEFSNRLSNAPPDFVFRLALQLLKRKETVPRFLAYELVQHHREALRSLNSGKLKLLGEGINDWAAVDTFACYLAGPAWRERQVPDTLIARWAHSRDRWWRRAALVSTVPLNSKARGGAGDPARTLSICEMLVSDRDDMVVKALSWALRELTKRDPQAVRGFLRTHQAVLAPRVIREVQNKLRTGLKNPRSDKLRFVAAGARGRSRNTTRN
jgi:3-methyladenine DNA glycosylase AlkD